MGFQGGGAWPRVFVVVFVFIDGKAEELRGIGAEWLEEEGLEGRVGEEVWNVHFVVIA